MEQYGNTEQTTEVDALNLTTEEQTEQAGTGPAVEATNKSIRWLPDTLGWWNIALSLLMIGLLYLPWVEVTMNDTTYLSIVPGKLLPDWTMRYVVVMCIINIAVNFFRRFAWLNASYAVMLACACYASMEAWEEARQYARQMVGEIPFTNSVSSQGLFYNNTYIRFAGEELHITDGGYFWLAGALAAVMLIIALFCWVKTFARITKHKENAVTHVVIGGIGTVLALFIYLFCASKMTEADGNVVKMLTNLLTSSGGNIVSLLVLHIMPVAALMGLAHAIGTQLISAVSHRKSEAVGLVPRRRKLFCICAALVELLVLIIMVVITVRFVNNKIGDTPRTENTETTDDTEEVYDDEDLSDYNFEEEEGTLPLLSGYKFEVRERKDSEFRGEPMKYLVARMPDGTEYDVTDDCPNLRILLQADYMDDGENVALVYEETGGSALLTPYFVYFDKNSRRFATAYGFEEALEDPDISIALSYGHRYFMQRVGRRRDYYELTKDGEVKLRERSGRATGYVIATVTLEQVFGDSDDQEERFYSIDIDRDDVPETLMFYHGQEKWLDWGKKMQLRSIRFADGREYNTQGHPDGETFKFIASSGDLPDILCDDAWLYRWDGDNFVLEEE